MPLDTELTTLIARPRAWQRAQRWPGFLLLVVGLWSLVYAEWWGLAFAAVGFWGAAEAWRGIRVTGGTLVMQGRVLRRTLPLTAIRQVGLSPARTLWVQPHEGRTLVLHMAESRTDQPGTFVDVHDRLRQLVVDAGGELEPELEEWIRPPRPATPFFGW